MNPFFSSRMRVLAGPVSISWLCVAQGVALGEGVLGSKEVSNVYSYLYGDMDQFHQVINDPTTTNACFDIYKFKDAAGNHFAASGFMGDTADLMIDQGATNEPHKSIECFGVKYSAVGSQGFNWAGVYWQFPETNWGTLPAFYDLRGVNRLRFFAKGEVGGEQVEFKLGGINRPPYHDPTLPFQDSCDLLSTGTITLSNKWTEYSFDLENPEFLWIYTNKDAPQNHFIPSGWMGDYGDLAYDDGCTNSPFSPPTCIKITYSAAATQGNAWAGIYWQFPANNWGQLPGGYDLTGAKHLTFRARADLPIGATETGLMKFLCGGINQPLNGDPSYTNQDSFTSPPLWVNLTANWQEYTIDLTGVDLSNTIGGFCWVTSQALNPAGCVIYLDDMRFDKLVSKDMSHTIGGFCFAVDKAHDPAGCTFYLADIQYLFSKTNWQQRLNQRGFLSSFQVLTSTNDDALRNVGFVYDNALAMLAFIGRGTKDDWARTKLIADSFCTAQERDRYFNNDDPKHPRFDGRLRDAYRAGDLLDASTGRASLPGWYDVGAQQWFEDPGFDSSSTGNMAWAIIALLSYYQHDPNPKYLIAATNLGNWILKNKSATGFEGFTGGYAGFDLTNSPVPWKSTEHNLDSYIAFKMLANSVTNTTEKAKWRENSLYAKGFVLSMWEPTRGCFWTGTEISSNGQEILNQSVIPLDVQDWAMMALDVWRNYTSAMSWAELNCGSESDGFTGFDFSLMVNHHGSTTNGVWFEGTGQMATAYQILGKFEEARFYISEIEKAAVSPIDGEGHGIPAASHDGVATGFTWNYFKRLHVGASSWYLFAANGFNPYLQISTPARVQNDLNLSIKLLPVSSVQLLWNGNAAYSFVVEACTSEQLRNNAWTEKANLAGEDNVMSWVDSGVLNQMGSSDRCYRIKILNR